MRSAPTRQDLHDCPEQKPCEQSDAFQTPNPVLRSAPAVPSLNQPRKDRMLSCDRRVGRWKILGVAGTVRLPLKLGRASVGLETHSGGLMLRKPPRSHHQVHGCLCVPLAAQTAPNTSNSGIVLHLARDDADRRLAVVAFGHYCQ